jgi:hypothetical protein
VATAAAPRRRNPVSFASACEGGQRKAECEARQNFIHVMTVRQCMPHANIEAELVIDLPYRPDETR